VQLSVESDDYVTDNYYTVTR